MTLISPAIFPHLRTTLSVMAMSLAILAGLVPSAAEPTLGRNGLEMGYYCGLSTLYPYAPVYCPQANCLGDCRGVFMFNSKSAPLPDTETACRYAALDIPPPKNWYQWEPRITPNDRQKYIGKRVCYLEDKGEARDINDLPR